MTLKRRKEFKEEDLFDPICKWLINNGYTVQAEVQSCDVVAQKDDEMLIIELKKSFNLQLVYQCLERQKLSPIVYAAIANPNRGKRNKNFNKITNLLKRLGIGLFVVHLYKSSSIVDHIHEAQTVKVRKNARKKNKVLNEISKRSGNYNKGGKQGKIITAYREAALHVYFLLHKRVEASPSELIKDGAPPNTGNILRDNHYGWYHKIARGRYTFDVDLKDIKTEYGEVLEYLEDTYSNEGFK